MGDVEKISKRPPVAADSAKTDATAKIDDGAAPAPLDDWYSDPEVLRRFGQMIAKSVWRPLGSK